MDRVKSENAKRLPDLRSLFLLFKNNPQLRLKLIMVAGIIGILLIVLSECSGNPKEKREQIEIKSGESVSDAANLENKLKKMIENIEGAGKTDVMITFENDGETVYASEKKMLEEKTQNDSGFSGESQKVQEKSESEEKYIMVDSDDGKTALISSKIAPQICGVVVVCDGGDDPLVAEKLVRTVKTALNIGSNRICVLKRGS